MRPLFQDSKSLNNRAQPFVQQRLWAWFLFVSFVFWPDMAWADPSSADTLGRMFCNAKDSLSPLAPVMGAMAYCAAGIISVKGAYLLKKHADQPAQQPVSAGIWHFLTAGALAGLPSFVAALQETLGVSGAGGVSGCNPGTVGDAQSLDVMMQNFVNNIAHPMTTLISTIGILVGIFYVYRGLLAASKIGSDPRASATHLVLSNLIIGAILISIGGMLPMVLETLFGTSSFQKLSNYAIINWSKITPNSANTDAADKTVSAILMFIQIIGMISFLRGWMILKKASEGGQATVPQGLTHIIGGAMAVNIGAMLKIIDKTMGTGVIN